MVFGADRISGTEPRVERFGVAFAGAGSRRRRERSAAVAFFGYGNDRTDGGHRTYPFLVGVAWWDAGGLEVEQFFMREHSEEHALLVTLAERMAERRGLVTL